MTHQPGSSVTYQPGSYRLDPNKVKPAPFWGLRYTISLLAINGNTNRFNLSLTLRIAASGVEKTPSLYWRPLAVPSSELGSPSDQPIFQFELDQSCCTRMRHAFEKLIVLAWSGKTSDGQFGDILNPTSRKKRSSVRAKHIATKYQSFDLTWGRAKTAISFIPSTVIGLKRGSSSINTFASK